MGESDSNKVPDQVGEEFGRYTMIENYRKFRDFIPNLNFVTK